MGLGHAVERDDVQRQVDRGGADRRRHVERAGRGGFEFVVVEFETVDVQPIAQQPPVDRGVMGVQGEMTGQPRRAPGGVA
jgi:hypothetical protein